MSDSRLRQAEETRAAAGCPELTDVNALLWRAVDLLAERRAIATEQLEAWIADGTVLRRLNERFETPAEVAEPDVVIDFLRREFDGVDVRDRGNGVVRLLAVLVRAEEALVSLYKHRLR